MNTVFSRAMVTIGLLGMSAVALADEPKPVTPKPATPQEPIGFVTGAVIGAFAAKAEATVAALQTDKSELESEKSTLLNDKNELTEANRGLSARLGDLTNKVETEQKAREDASETLDGLQGDVLFRTGSAEITPEIAHQIEVLAQAVAKSPELKVRVDGYADPRGSVDDNLKLSQARANAVRDLFLAAGIDETVLEVNAYGKSQSVASDNDGYALERRVRLTLQAQDGAAVAQVNVKE
jgi:outer membrane protein OmpA-like peptidoglycan-associated protein